MTVLPSDRIDLDGTESVRVFILGRFDVQRGPLTLALPMSARRLVAFLTVHERPLPRDHVAGTLWSEVTEESALACLRSTLWRIARRDRTLIRVEDGMMSIAAHVFIDHRDAIARGNTFLTDPAHPPGPHDVSTFSEDLLPGWTDEWLIADREQFHQLRLHVLEVLSRRLSSQGRHADAVHAALSAVAGDPLRESARRALMEVHLAEGNLSDALRCYDDYRRSLELELGLRPSEIMEELVTRMRSNFATSRVRVLPAPLG